MGVIDLNARLKTVEDTVEEYGATLDQLDTAVDGCLPLTGGTITGDLYVNRWKETGSLNTPVYFGTNGTPVQSYIWNASLATDLDAVGVIPATGGAPADMLVGGLARYAGSATGAFASKSGVCLAIPVSNTKMIQFAMSVDGDKLGLRIGEIGIGQTSLTYGAWKSVTLS